MAIKISGTTVIDNSRNLTNIAAGTLSGSLTANSIAKSGGTSSQFLKADGTVDSNSYASTGKAIAMAIVFG